MFGVTLDTPREIRTEESAQGRQIAFAFAGFSGYTVLLLILVCYKEFGDLMPFTSNLENRGFNEEMRLLATWMFMQSVTPFSCLLGFYPSPVLLHFVRFDSIWIQKNVEKAPLCLQAVTGCVNSLTMLHCKKTSTD